jgi:preprotein translocase subunit SecF
MIYERFTSWYSRHYRLLMIIPVLLFLSTVPIFYNNLKTTGDLLPRDIDLSGGTLVTVYTSSVSPGVREAFVSKGFSFREVDSYETGELVAVTIEAGPDFTGAQVVSLVNSSFPGSPYDIRTVGPSLGASFMEGAQKAILFSFVAMGVILAFIFRQRIVALTIVLSGLLNVSEAAAYMTLFGIKLAPHTIGALLMLMAWSVDSEVLFDTKIFKHEGDNPKKRATDAMKTAMTMTLAASVSLLALYFVSTSSLVKDIVLVLLLGTIFDTVNTWFQSLAMVLWYVEGKK